MQCQLSAISTFWQHLNVSTLQSIVDTAKLKLYGVTFVQRHCSKSSSKQRQPYNKTAFTALPIELAELHLSAGKNKNVFIALSPSKRNGMTKESRMLRRMSKVQEMREPPDGGWGWVLVIAGTAALANYAAATRCFSVFYVPLKLHYDTDFADVAWLNGLMQTSYGVACVFVHFAIKRFGFRPLTMISSVVACASIFCGAWATPLWLVQILAGLVPGVCMACTNMCTFTIVTRYFKKRLNTATQIMCSGLTMGALAFCPVYQWLMDMYGWRGAFQIIAGFFLQIAIVGALMRPIVLREDFDPNFLKEIEKPAMHDEGKDDPNNNEDTTNNEISTVTETVRLSEDSQQTDNADTLPYLRKREKPKSNKQKLVALCVKAQLDVFSEPLFYGYTFGWVTFGMAYFSALTYLVPFGLDAANLSAMQSSSLMSAVMAGEVISRIVCGTTLDRVSTANKIVVTGASCLAMSFVFIFLSFLRSYHALLIGCALLGMCGGGMDGVYSVFIVDFFGVKRYASVYGYGNIIIHSLGMATTVLTGKCVDATGHLQSAFYVGSAGAILSMICCILMRQVYLKKQGNDKKKDSSECIA